MIHNQLKHNGVVQKLSELEMGQQLIIEPESGFRFGMIYSLNGDRRLKPKKYKVHKLTALRSYQITRVA